MTYAQVRLARADLRALIRRGESMDTVAKLARVGAVTWFVHNRFERLWIYGTATAHPRTSNMPLESWRARRARIRQAIQKL